ncbi:MAG: DUF2975 domain-containing protein [Oscillospiraceae bacterium]|nr:DUF2975 domain-containing protein [Oscillospiraceae bacterium]
MYKNSWVHYVTKIVVDIMFYGGILACLATPWIVVHLFGLTEIYLAQGCVFAISSTFIHLTAIFFLSGVCGVYILWQFKKLFKTLLGGNPFVPANVNCFRKIAVASLIIAILFAIRCIIYFTFASAVVVVIFALATLFCLTLKDLFKQAVDHKQENDLTV